MAKHVTSNIVINSTFASVDHRRSVGILNHIVADVDALRSDWGPLAWVMAQR